MARARGYCSMYLSMKKIEVREELEKRPDIVEKLGRFKHKFINWCAKQRTIYESDIDDEFSEFNEKFIKNRLYNTDVKLWKKIANEIFVRDNFTCQYCGQIGGILEVDHILPVSKGGSNDYSNLVTACRKCNRRKKDKIVKVFRAEES